METVGIEPTAASVQAKRPATGIPRRCERVDSNHHSTRQLLYRQLSSPVLSVRALRAAGRNRTGTAGFTGPDARRYITATTIGVARVGFEPTISSS
jgi:hypothetical protein